MITFLYFLAFYWAFAHLLVFTAFFYLNNNKIKFTTFLYFIVSLFIGGIILPIVLGAYFGYLIYKINH